MRTIGSPLGAALIGSLPAGPLFVGIAVLAMMIGSIPEPIPLRLGEVIGLVLVLAVSIAPGFFLALVPNMFGCLLMAHAGERSELAREPLAWSAAGAAAGAGIAALTAGFGDYVQIATALIATSAVCARICRAQLDWEAQQ